MGYASLETVATLIAPQGQADLILDNEETMARLAQINDAMSDLFDQEVLGGNGAQVASPYFGGTEAATARVVPCPSQYGAAILALPVPLRSMTTIVIAGDFAETVATDDYGLTYQTRRGDYLGLFRIQGNTWPPNNGRSTITVTGIWADTPLGGDVPAVVVEALNFIVMEQWRLEQASPAEEIGPDGETVRPRNPWKFSAVVKAINRYKVALPLPAI